MKKTSILNIISENQAIRIQLEGDLLIRDAVELKEELSAWLENYQSIEICFKNIDSIDISVLQLLVALQKSALEVQKQVTYRFEESEYLSNILNNSGYYKFLSA